MKFENPISLKDLCHKFEADFIGNPDLSVQGINEIHRVETGDIAFVDNKKYYERALKSQASVIIIDQKIADLNNKSIIIHPNPFKLFNEISKYFNELKQLSHSENIIHNSAIIHPNVTLGKNIRIGENSIIYPGTYIGDNVTIENNVIIGPNSVVGHYAFYYKATGKQFDRLLTCGGIHIHDNVEIGALCSIDSGVTHTTNIGKGTKVDNQVQIGHDTQIGEHCLFASGVGIAGCVIIGNRVVLWGQVGVASGVEIGNDTVVLAQSGVSKSLEGGKTYFGSPCIPAKQMFKEIATVRSLTKQRYDNK